MNHTDPFPQQLGRLQRWLLLVGILGLGLCAAGAFVNPAQFFRSYLFAHLFWIGIALGCLAIAMLHHLVGGVWGLVIRRLLESAALTLPLLAVLFVPILFGLPHLYAWARPEEVAHSEALQHKSLYLNPAFFVLRTVVYFAIWNGMAYLLRTWSRQHDRTAAPALLERLRRFSAPGLGLYGLTVTFASIDWVMSLEPEWYSTIYGMSWMVGQAVAGFAFVMVTLALLANREPFPGVLLPAHVHDLGNLLLAFVLVWMYLEFSQYLIIWSGNLTEEIPWYLHRTLGGWQWIGLLLFLFHFTLPFLLLLSRGVKRSVQMLSVVAGTIVVMHLLDQFWRVAPAFSPGLLRLHWLDVAAPVGVGGIWLAGFVWGLRGGPLLPLHEPRLQEAVEHEASEHG